MRVTRLRRLTRDSKLDTPGATKQPDAVTVTVVDLAYSDGSGSRLGLAANREPPKLTSTYSVEGASDAREHLADVLAH